MRFDTAQISNPKRLNSQIGRELFPYYAGYSPDFAVRLMQSLKLDPTAKVLDPWNGAGTSTTAACALGFAAAGCDINPAMLLVAKASLLPSVDAPSVLPLAREILESTAGEGDLHEEQNEPLTTWFASPSASVIRRLESSINRMLVQHTEDYADLGAIQTLREVSAIAALMYVALFRTVRVLARDFIASNPTWIKNPHYANRKRPTRNTIVEVFLSQVKALESRTSGERDDVEATFLKASSRSLPVQSSAVDLILTSPPYCTRIDYAKATALELAVLRFGQQAFNQLRDEMLGTSTIKTTVDERTDLGPTCATFLQAMQVHPSKASEGYYYKNHYQYFAGLAASMQEIGRVLKPQGSCVMVVQDSYYKELRNDLAAVVTEMGALHGLRCERRQDFVTRRSMVNVNTRSRRYLNFRDTTESVVCLTKER